MTIIKNCGIARLVLGAVIFQDIQCTVQEEQINLEHARVTTT
jgi:hypothetical protein